jgi:DNA-binding transcriptional ArsR family regulator
MPESEYILAPQVVSIGFDLQPTANAIESLMLMTETERLSGLGDWIVQTEKALPPELRARNMLVMQTLDLMFYTVLSPTETAPDDFLQYVADLERLDPYWMRDTFIKALTEIPVKHPEVGERFAHIPTPEELLADSKVYLNFVQTMWPECAEFIDVFDTTHALLIDPPEMQRVIVTHLREMWDTVLGQEWQHIRPMLEEAVHAFSQQDFTGMTVYEAIRAVTDRDIRGYWDQKIANVTQLVMVPSAHIGPYVGKFMGGSTLYVFFGARQPRGSRRESSALNRSELLIRLNALADDTRLRILELLTENEELCAQDMMERLDLSQSTVSRHLSQLAATGYVTERRREVQKCYTLNTDRVIDTLRALTNFLSRQ